MSHRSIIKWNQWLNEDLGQVVLHAEQTLLNEFLSEKYGKHVVLVGVPHQHPLINALHLPCHSLITPLPIRKQSELTAVESTLYELPMQSGSIDVVLLPHTLELVDNPRQLLAEACRIIKPEGHLIICGFNPYSLWGLSKLILPKAMHFPAIHSVLQGTLKQWLRLSDFELVKQSHALYSPPVQNKRILKNFRFLEWLGRQGHLPCGAVYILMARAKVIPLTPIRLRWKQSVAGMRIPTSIPGPTIRNAK